jgi:Uncharacterized protein conserved in bacteria
MFRSGQSIDEIAKQRSLSRTTIENHLIRYLATGEVTLEELVPLEKLAR